MIVNGKEISVFMYNGNPLSRIMYNGMTLWSYDGTTRARFRGSMELDIDGKGLVTGIRVVPMEGEGGAEVFGDGSLTVRSIVPFQQDGSMEIIGDAYAQALDAATVSTDTQLIVEPESQASAPGAVTVAAKTQVEILPITQAAVPEAVLCEGVNTVNTSPEAFLDAPDVQPLYGEHCVVAYGDGKPSALAFSPLAGTLGIEIWAEAVLTCIPATAMTGIGIVDLNAAAELFTRDGAWIEPEKTDGTLYIRQTWTAERSGTTLYLN